MNAETTIAFDHMFDELSALSKVIDVYDGAIVWSKNHPEKLVINANLGSRIGGKENYLNSNQIESIHSGKSLEENIFTFIQNPEPDNAVIEFSIAINNRPLIWFRGRLIIHNEHSVLILLSEITELIESQKALESALVLSDEQNKRLKSFTHIISHNLRSHSSNIELLLETMKLTNPDILKAEEMVYLAKVSTKLSETINHLNEVVHMNSSLSWAMKPLNVFEYLSNAVVNMKALADDAGVTIEIKPFSKTIRASAVPTYLDNIFLNFITNAIKYKNPKVKSELTISVSIVKSSVAISFADNGLGIDLSKNRSKLFGMYKVFHKNKDARGIGLFITKNQIESMNGEFKVESQVGKGSTFTVILNRE